MFGETEMPRQGDIIYISAEPHSGRKYGDHDPESGNTRRPMLVVSDDVYNSRTGFVVGFPIATHKPKNDFPAIKLGPHKIHGYVFFSPLGYDYISRQGEIVEQASRAEREQAMAALRDLLGLY